MTPLPNLSYHARARAVELGIDPVEVQRIVNTYRLRTSDRYRRGCFELDNGSFRAVWNPEQNVIVTVKLKTYTPYEHGVHSMTNMPERGIQR